MESVRDRLIALEADFKFFKREHHSSMREIIDLRAQQAAMNSKLFQSMLSISSTQESRITSVQLVHSRNNEQLDELEGELQKMSIANKEMMESLSKIENTANLNQIHLSHLENQLNRADKGLDELKKEMLEKIEALAKHYT